MSDEGLREEMASLPFVGEENETDVGTSNNFEEHKSNGGYNRRRINNDSNDPNSWYKHRRKRNKRIRNGKNSLEEDATKISVDLDQFVYLLSPDTANTSTRVIKNLGLEDAQYIVHHLGYTPFNLMTVAYYHPEKIDSAGVENAAFETQEKPAVLQLYPLNPYTNNNYLNRYDKDHRPFQNKKGETLFPFPTLFWMLSPSINTAVAALEEEGWINRLTERLRSEPAYITQMQSAHRAYATERWGYLSPEHKQYVETKGWTNNLLEVGIAGMQAFDAVKCLHTHYAHYLARPEHGNLIGQWVHDLLQSSASAKQLDEDNHEG